MLCSGVKLEISSSRMGLGPAKAISPAKIFDRQANLAPGVLPLKRRRKKGVLNRPTSSSASNTLPVDTFATMALNSNKGERKTSKNKEKSISKVLGNMSIIKMAACSNQILHPVSYTHLTLPTKRIV